MITLRQRKTDNINSVIIISKLPNHVSESYLDLVQSGSMDHINKMTALSKKHKHTIQTLTAVTCLSSITIQI